MVSPEYDRSLLALNGYALPPRCRAPIRRAVHVGRNEPCPCGSGRKFKRCCGR